MTVCFHFSLTFTGYGRRRQQALDHQQRRRRSSDENTAPIAPGTSSDLPRIPQRRKNFLKSPLLYQNAFLYVFSRLFMTTALVYIPLWLDERSWTPNVLPSSSANQFNPYAFRGDQSLIAVPDDDKSVEHIATVPLVSFLASFLASMAMKYSNRLFGHQVAYLLGSITSVAGCVWVALGAPPSASSIRLYGIAVLFGAGSSVTMISSLCITADMIGRHADQSGFIYSAVTFADKLITGVVVIVIEAL